MKKLESLLTIKGTRGALKRLTLGLAASAAVVVGSGLTANAAPANDNFADAINLPGRTGTQTGTDNLDATLEANEPNPGASDTVWFKWTCTTDGVLTVGTLGSTASGGGEWDAILGIYTGASVDALTPLGTTPQDTGLAETMTLPVNAGTTYYIQLAGFVNAVAANIRLTWNLVVEANMITFGPGATINGTNIAWEVLIGTDLTTLAPTYTTSYGATCPIASGSPTDFSLGPVHYVVSSSDSLITNNYRVTVTAVPEKLLWSAGGGGDWDTGTPNWTGYFSGTPSLVFANGDTVVFNDATGNPIINVWPDMDPLSTTVSATNGTITFVGGPIAGSGSLTKSGGGTLTIGNATATTNTYTGKTIVRGGTLVSGLGPNYLSNAGVPGVFGAPTGANATIDLYNGVTLQNNGSNPRFNQATDRPLNLAGTGPGTVSVRFNDNDTSLTFSNVTATGTGAKTLALFTGNNGNGDREAMIFTGAIADSSDGSPTALAVTFRTQTGSTSWVSLSGVNTFTGPITLTPYDGNPTGTLVIGGVRAPATGANTVGTGKLGNGNYPGAIALGTKTILEYDSTAAQILSGPISGVGVLTKTGSGTLTLSGTNTYKGDTTVSAGTLVLGTTGVSTFYLTDFANNRITGAGTATLNGTLAIDTSAVTVSVGSWTLVNVTTKNYGGTFGVQGFTGPGPVWTRVDGAHTWTFNQTTGVLTLTSKALIISFGIPFHPGIINQNAKTIALTVPPGTVLATLAPTFTLSSGTCNQTSGSPPSPNFGTQNPATYTVTDGAAVNNYVVTVTVSDTAAPWFNVNMDNVARTNLIGPIGGSGLGWNQRLTAAVAYTGANLLDISGSPTTVGYRTVSLDGLDAWGTPSLQVLAAGLRRFGLNGSWSLIVTNLPYRKFNLYIASGNTSSQLSYGEFSTTNLTDTGSPVYCDNTGGVISDTWVEGNNFVVFSNIVPDPNGNIQIDVFQPSYRAPLNGFQIADISAGPPRSYKSIANIFFQGLGSASANDNTGTNFVLLVPPGTAVTSLAPTYTVGVAATGSPASGTVRNFTTPQTYVVTAEDLSQQAYSVTVVALSGPVGYQATVLAARPVHYWPLNERSGTTAVDLVGGNNLTYGGTYTLGQPGLELGPNCSVLFSGAGTTAGQWTGVPYNATLNPINFTVECWVKATDATVQYLVSLQDRAIYSGVSGRMGYAIWKNNPTGFGMQWGTGATTTGSINSPNAVVVGNVYHVVGTYDGTTMSLYENGVLVNSLDAPIYQPAGTNQPGFSIGSRNGVSPAPSYMQDVALYDRALTPDEILTHYQNPPVLRADMSAGKVRLMWFPGDGTLLESTTGVTGPYNPVVPAATWPYTITPSAGSMFWRVKF
jgi:autotransporter-associated beta strand protein